MNKCIKALALLTLTISLALPLHGAADLKKALSPCPNSLLTQVKASLSNITGKQILFVGAGLVGSALIGKLLYNCFKQLTDIQEIESAHQFCHQATCLHNEIASAYHHEHLIMIPLMNLSVQSKYNSTLTSNINASLIQEIRLKFSKHPLYNYIHQLDNSSYKLTSTAEKLVKKKIHLVERKYKLFKDKKKSEQEIKSLILEYDATIASFDPILDEIHYTKSLLGEIKRYITNTQEYQYELSLVRIVELEREVQRLKYNCYHKPTYTHHNHTHIHVAPKPYVVAAPRLLPYTIKADSYDDNDDEETQDISNVMPQTQKTEIPAKDYTQEITPVAIATPIEESPCADTSSPPAWLDNSSI